MLATFEVSALLLGLAALVTAVGGIVSTVLSVRAGRKEADRRASEAKGEADYQCHKRLLAMQREAESLSDQLYRLRLRWNETEADEQ